MEINPGQTLSHYHLIEKIGQGGMGVVWKARDAILGRDVAIKLLPADHALDEQRRRMFLEEARLASSVSDAHIVQVFELGREGDLDFIVMEYVEGEPLSRSLTGRPQSPDRVAALGAQIASALARAHRKQLLHRDIKPGNILVTPEGDAKLVDFGLAGLFQQGQSTFGATMSTQPLSENTSAWVELGGHRVFGTLPYMSPEQVRGERLDQRSDIFSLGTVLYEMTTGRRPFRGESASEVAAEIRKATSRPPRELVPKVPMELDRIVVKSLASRPSERYQTMEDLAVDLRKLGRDLDSGSAPSYGELKTTAVRSPRRRAMTWAAVAVVLAVVAIGAAWMSAHWRESADPRTILILPLEVRGQTEGAAFVGRAFAEAMAVNLAQADGLKVLPVPEEKELGGSGSLDRARAARALNAGLLLAGSLTRVGDQIVADLNLTDSNQNRLVWGARLPGGDDNLAIMASSAVQQVEARLGVSHPKRYEYWDVAYGSEEFLASSELADARGAPGSAKVLETTRALVARFPLETYARFLRTRALWGSGNNENSSPGRHEFEESIKELNRLDPGNPWDDLMHGFLLDGASKQAEAVELFNRVLQRGDLSPRLRSWVLNLRGQALSRSGKDRAALRSYEEALKLTPLNIYSLGRASRAHQKLGEIERGLVLARQTFALAPKDPDALEWLGAALWSAGKLDKAIPYYETGCRLLHEATGSEQSCCSQYGEALAYAGEVAQALPVLKACCTQNGALCTGYATALHLAGRIAEGASAAKTAASDESVDALYGLATYHAVAGHREDAIRYLRMLIDSGFTDIWLATDPWLESLHGDPEFEAIVAEMKKRLES